MRISETMVLRDELCVEMYRAVGDEDLSNPTYFNRAADVISSHINQDTDLVRGSLAGMELGEASKDVIRTISWRFVGMARNPLSHTWSKSSPIQDPELVGMEIKEWRRAKRSAKGNDQVALFIQVLQGAAATAVMRRTFAVPFLWVWSREIGFTRSHKWSGHPGELVLLWFKAVLKSVGGKIEIGRYEVDAECMRHNKALISARREPCIRSYQLPCSNCAVGYKKADDMCWRATRPHSLERRACDREPPHEGYFHPDSQQTACIECLYVERSRNAVMTKGVHLVP